jgi:hypothetical protein
VEPITLAAVGITVLTQGITFLYAQAGEVIKRWRDKRDQPVPVPENAPLNGELKPATINPSAMATLEDQIIALRAALAPYADAIAPAPVDPTNQDLLAVADALRRALEAVIGQRIRFQGEPGQPSGPLVEGKVNIDDVLGYVAGVRARSISGGVVRGLIIAKTLGPGATAVGVDIGDIGPVC